MDSAHTQSSETRDPRVYFAAERTLLAWVRTGLAMMGFGFVVARFGLFLREMASLRQTSLPHRTGFSLWVGVLLVLAGVAVNIGAAIKHWQHVRRLDQGLPLRFRAISLGVLVAGFLALLGLITAGLFLTGLH